MSRLLADFRLDAGVYFLGQFSPVSIKDQIVRANYLVNALCDCNELSASSKLVIVGAGAAGVACALAARHRGISADKISVIEKSDRCLALQSGVNSRWLEPVQYDWPAAHWIGDTWPIPNTGTHSGQPSLKADYACNWAVLFQNWLFGTEVDLCTNTSVHDWVENGGHYEISTFTTGGESSSAKHTHDAHVLIVATGFGHEKVYLDQGTGSHYQGIEFWSNDRFENPLLGMDEPGPVLVSGDGDGGLQDFIRMVCGVRSVKTFMEAIYGLAGANETWPEALNQLWHWEDNARRSRNFISAIQSECMILESLHQSYLSAIEKLLKSPDWVKVVSYLDKVTEQGSRRNVVLQGKCTHFTWCYPLNRVAALIILKYLEAKGVQALMPSTLLTSVEPTNHECTKGCWGKPHVVKLLKGTHCDITSDEIQSLKSQDQSQSESSYLGVVIRHGIELLVNGNKLQLGRQEVPAHLP